MGTAQQFSPAGFPQSNAIVERVIGNLKQRLKRNGAVGSELHRLKMATSQINHAIHNVTKESPVSVAFGVRRDGSEIPIDEYSALLTNVLERIKKSHEITRRRHFKKYPQHRGIKTGDFVLFHNKDKNKQWYHPDWKGPFDVVQKLSDRRFF